MTWLVIWLVIMVILVIIEFCGLSLLTIWFAIAALISGILAALNVPLWIQWIVFAVVSFLLFAFVRPQCKKIFDRKRRDDEVYALVGKRGIVISEIDNLRGIGQVNVMGREWSAMSREKDVIFPRGTVVDVVGVRGHKLVIRRNDSMGNMELRTSDATLDPDYIEKNW